MQTRKINTSLIALREQIRTGKFRTNAARVANELRIGGAATKNELMDRLSMQHQTLTSQLSFLKDIGAIVEGDIAPDGCRYNHYVPDPEKQLEHAAKRREEKFKKWVEQGLRQFPEETAKMNLDFLIYGNG